MAEEKIKLDADISGNDPSTIWDNPLFLPAGSVRSLIALLIVVFSGYYLMSYQELPETVSTILAMVLGWYFGNRK